MGSIFLWWFVVWVAGFTTFPITFVALKYLPDRGYIFSKILSLLLLGYLTWLLGYISFGAGTILLSFLILLALSGTLLWNWTGEAFLKFIKKDLFYFIVFEFFFLVAFLVAGAFKMHTHDIAGTEKPMDFAMINGILASPSMPPQDPWLSGGGISYYYFGYLIVAMLCKITAVSPGEAYNLAVALTWALAMVGAFSLAYALTRRYRYSLFSAACLALFGNLDFWHRALQRFLGGDFGHIYFDQPANPNVSRGFPALLDFLWSPLQQGWNYFQSSRIMTIPPSGDKMINEFPSFSFFLSDLHPHVMAIPFVLLALALAYNLLKAPLPGLQIFGGRQPWQTLQWALFAVVFGGLSFLNSWDFPTFMFLLGLCLFLQQWWASGTGFDGWFKAVCVVGIPMVLAAFIFYAPFYLGFQSQAQGLGIAGSRTDLYFLAVIFGLFFIVLIPALAGKAFAKSEKVARAKAKGPDAPVCVICGAEGQGKKFCGNCGGELVPALPSEVIPLPDEPTRVFLNRVSSWLFSASDPTSGWISLAAAVVVLLALNFLSLKLGTLFFAFLLVVLCLLSLAGKTESKEMVFATLLATIGFLLIGFCEIFYMKDLFSSGNNQSTLHRMNTIFKFHYQVWILFSVAAAPFLKWLMENQWPQWATWKKTVWLSLALPALLGAALYPLLTFTFRMRETANAIVTMDGAVFYETVYPVDYQVAQWIKANVKPIGRKVPIILEAWGDSYAPTIEQSGGRLATLTGYPTVLGWAWHEVQWRGTSDHAVIRGRSDSDTIMQREGDITAVYTATDPGLAKNLLKKYGVDYVYVGDVERAKYKEKLNMGVLSQLGVPALNAGNSVLYKVNP